MSLATGNSFGFIGKDYALVASDARVPRSILVMKSYDDKIVKVAPRTLFALTGEVGDRKNFGEYIQRNIKWYEMRNNRTLDNKAIANFTRNELAWAIRRNPYVVWVLQAGYDDETGPSLYWMDYYGTLCNPNTAAQGLSAYFLLSLFDRYWKENLTVEEGIVLVKKCIHQLHKRYLIAENSFIVKIVNKDGIQQINLNKKFVIEDEKIAPNVTKTNLTADAIMSSNVAVDAVDAVDEAENNNNNSNSNNHKGGT